MGCGRGQAIGEALLAARNLCFGLLLLLYTPQSVSGLGAGNRGRGRDMGMGQRIRGLGLGLRGGGLGRGVERLRGCLLKTGSLLNAIHELG